MHGSLESPDLLVPFRGQKADPDRPDEVEPGGWELLAVSAGGRVHGGSVGSGSDAEEADAGEVSERGAPSVINPRRPPAACNY